MWGLIYFLQAVAVVWAAIPWAHAHADGAHLTSRVRAVGAPWLLGWLFESLWTFAFRAETLAGMCVALVFIVAAFASFAASVARIAALPPLPSTWHGGLLYALFNVASSLNAGWLSAASAVAAVVVPVAKGGVAPSALTGVGVALLALVTMLAVAVSLKKTDAAWPAVVAWAALGVALGAKGGGAAVTVAAFVCLAVAAAAAVLAQARLIKARRGGAGGGVTGAVTA